MYNVNYELYDILCWVFFIDSVKGNYFFVTLILLYIFVDKMWGESSLILVILDEHLYGIICIQFTAYRYELEVPNTILFYLYMKSQHIDNLHKFTTLFLCLKFQFLHNMIKISFFHVINHKLYIAICCQTIITIYVLFFTYIKPSFLLKNSPDIVFSWSST